MRIVKELDLLHGNVCQRKINSITVEPTSLSYGAKRLNGERKKKTVGMTARERERVTFRRAENNGRDEAPEQNRGTVDEAFGGQIMAFNTAAEFQFWPLFSIVF